ncbi:hypothetical protein ACH6EH_06985 [Paenibacillus sp. JSM ZJ436]|uniref:hypothetical protein n=1 Tax=Paenibacillus sp. JSM ZJ436 TaxID=3376190 RepID=UPI00378A324B
MDYKKVIENTHFLINAEQVEYDKCNTVIGQMEIHERIVKLLEIQLEIYKQVLSALDTNVSIDDVFRVIATHWDKYSEEEKNLFTKFMAGSKQQ